MNNYIRVLLGFVLFAAGSLVARAQATGTTTCSNGINTAGTTCAQTSIGHSGAVRCTCSAACLSPCAKYSQVYATSAFQWGTYVPPNKECLTEINGRATGGSTGGGVYAQTEIISGWYIANLSVSRMEWDCKLGLVSNQPPITGYC
jgi:hypothetical protein